jgi:hypothetical protein
LRNVLLTLSYYENPNFLHINKILTDSEFRKKVLFYVDDVVIKDFWEKEFNSRNQKFKAEALSPILNKI